MKPADKQWHMRPNRDKALMMAQRELSALVCDAVNLEGIPFTLPEIQTLLDGITVGGHKLSDQQIALNQANAWKHLFQSIKSGIFTLTSDYACELHAIAAKEEALSWGTFRQGNVTIAGTDYLPPDHQILPSLFEKMADSLQAMDDVYDQAIAIFLLMARNQFFYDVNKRMGRFMMNGWLLSNGYPVINLPAKRQLEFNQLMLDFYGTGDQAQMNSFMRSCLDPRIVRIMSE